VTLHFSILSSTA